MLTRNKSALSAYLGIYKPVDNYDVPDGDTAQLNPQKDLWHERRMRMLSRRCKLKQSNLGDTGPTERVCRLAELEAPDTLDQTDDAIKENIVHIVNQVLARDQEKRRYGLGLVGKWLNRKYKKNLTTDQLKFLNSLEDNRPYFTYWVTTVQALILLVTLMIYGIGPFGFSSSLIKDHVFVPSLSWQRVSYFERDNLWIGPRSADLIHLGAKFTPCMRKDRLVYDVIDADRYDEQFTGCCIRNDRSGCLQTHRDGCSYLKSKWFSWNASAEDAPTIYATGMKRTSGPVCGQDPRNCLHPHSTHPHEWSDDISKWPVCYKRTEAPTAPSHHISCELVGRPCCIGVRGQCTITTSQHCQFLRGTFHPEATLCSQVSCMEDVCGMIPFYARDCPDQFYRLFTALFLHTGVLHFSLTLFVQLYIMRDLEKLIGASRMAIIYLVSGFVGYLASAIFVPYHPQVGPSGSQFALLALLVAELINSWDYVEQPLSHLLKYLAIALGFFTIGLLPWIDNYAHVFGFLTGLLLSLALIPFLAPVDETKVCLKVVQVWACIVAVIVTIVVLILQLYLFPIYECSWCQYLDCLPLFPDWCTDQDMKKVERLDIF